MPNEVIKGMSFHHISLKASDYDKSVEYYKRLGMKQYVEWGSGDDRISMFDLGDGGMIEIFSEKNMPYPEEGRWQHFALAVRDVDAAYNTALAAGAVSVAKPAIMKLDDARPSRMTIYVAFVKGPDGEVIEFFKRMI